MCCPIRGLPLLSRGHRLLRRRAPWRLARPYNRNTRHSLSGHRIDSCTKTSGLSTNGITGGRGYRTKDYNCHIDLCESEEQPMDRIQGSLYVYTKDEDWTSFVETVLFVLIIIRLIRELIKSNISQRAYKQNKHNGTN